MSGTGKSTVVNELVARGHRAIDADYGWCETAPDGEWIWNEQKMQALLADGNAEVLFVAGCASNQRKFYEDFDLILLLSAPSQVMIERVATRQNNPFGRSFDQRKKIVSDLAEVEPLLRSGADVEIRTDRPLDEIVEEVLSLSLETTPRAGELVTETFDYDGGRQVTVYVPADPPDAVVFAGDGQHFSAWGRLLESTSSPSTMIVGVHGLTDEMSRLHEYSPVFAAVRFAAHEEFFVETVRRWVKSRFAVALPAERTAVFGYSGGGELALALGLRHPDLYGTVISGSPGGGYQPTEEMPSSLPRVYLFGGTQEPFFLDNATRWAVALREAGADVVLSEREVRHGARAWRTEFPEMLAWAFGP